MLSRMKFDYFWDEKIGPVVIFTFQNRNYGLCFCHRIPERSIPFLGLENYLCARCTGLAVGGALGLVLNCTYISFPPIPAALLLIPMLLDGFSQAFWLRISNNPLRFVTGFLFGLGMPSMLNFIFSFF
jgi:uncharacterized membrane protein